MSDSGSLDSASAPATAPRPDSPLADRIHPSPNHGKRRGCTKPDSLILHYTGMAQTSEALLWLANPLSQVSCHYFVFEDCRIWQMVPENRRAWHAGRSSWHGETDMNSRSIGIEIANAGHDLSKMPPNPGEYPDFPDRQIEAVIALVKDIVTRWSIPPTRILAHSDISPGRKVDPGEKFPWERLAAAGLGLWPAQTAPYPPKMPAYRLGDEGMPVAALQSMFAKFGYGIEITGVFDVKTEAVVAAFQRHWRQGCVDGVADAETLGVLRALMAGARST